MSTLTAKITELSVTFPPASKTSRPNTDPFISSRKNVLSIKLDENEKHLTTIELDEDEENLSEPPQVHEDLTSISVRSELDALKASQGPVHIGNLGRPFQGSAEVQERNTLLIHRIRKVASEDAARQPSDRIDCVEIGPGPWPEHLRALDGLSPKHLQVDAGIMEEINVSELDNLNTKFELESLSISSVSSRPKVFPKFFTHVKSLTLSWCCTFFLEGANLPTHLRQLKIVGNNAMDMFIFAVDNVPNATEQLENVFIYTDPYTYTDMSNAFWLNDFRKRLGRCKGLKELTLVIADDYEARAAKCARLAAQYPRAAGEPKGKDGSEPFDVALARSLPNGIERLEFHCSNSEPMLADLNLWLEAAEDPEWLPCLKSIHIRTYDPELDKVRIGKRQEATVDKERDGKISEKIERVYEVLRKRVPAVEVSEALALQCSSR